MVAYLSFTAMPYARRSVMFAASAGQAILASRPFRSALYPPILQSTQAGSKAKYHRVRAPLLLLSAATQSYFGGRAKAKTLSVACTVATPNQTHRSLHAVIVRLLESGPSRNQHLPRILYISAKLAAWQHLQTEDLSQLLSLTSQLKFLAAQPRQWKLQAKLGTVNRATWYAVS